MVKMILLALDESEKARRAVDSTAGRHHRRPRQAIWGGGCRGAHLGGRQRARREQGFRNQGRWLDPCQDLGPLADPVGPSNEGTLNPNRDSPAGVRSGSEKQRQRR